MKMTGSEMWQHFTKVLTGDGENKANCVYCAIDIYCHPKSNVLSALKNHIAVCQKYPYSRDTQVGFNSDLVSKVSKASKASKGGERNGEIGTLCNWNQRAPREALAEMIVKDNISYKFVEREGFKHFVSQACTWFCIPSRCTIMKDVYKLYLGESLKLRNILKNNCQRICLTMDTWSSVQGTHFICLTAHFVDDEWKLNKRLLSFCPISSRKGDVIGRTVEKCLLDWGIDKIFTITVDNASWNDDAIVCLKEKIENWGSSILRGEILHMRCIVDTINLVVVDTLKEMGELISRVRGLVRYVMQSSARLQNFQECVEIEKMQEKSLLRLDVPNRWDSTYLMLNVAQKYEKAFERFEEKDPYLKIELESGDGKGIPTADDWKTVRRLGTLLKRFYEFMLGVSRKLYFTSNTFFREILLSIFFLKSQKSEDIELRAMAKSMKQKYDKYSGSMEKMNLLLYVAAVLDPRHKFELVEYALCKMYEGEIGAGMGKKVRETTYALFEEYKSKIALQSEVLDSEDSDDEFRKFAREKEGWNDGCELDRYLNAGRVQDWEGFDVLQWWKSSSYAYPILSQMARDILAVPISKVSWEFAFGTRGRVLDTFRSSLTPTILEVLICVQDWLRVSSPLTNVEEDLEELETLETDLSNNPQEPTVTDL